MITGQGFPTATPLRQSHQVKEYHNTRNALYFGIFYIWILHHPAFLSNFIEIYLTMKKYLLIVSVALAALCGSAAKPYKVSILGDSYSTFERHVQPDTNYVWYFDGENKPERTDVNALGDTWWSQFIHDTGFELVKNNSFSGSTICHTGYNGEDYSGRSFITRMHYLGNPDIILVFGATNDLWANVPLEADSTLTDPLYAFRPAMKELVTGLPALYPGAKIYFMLNDEIGGDVRDIIIEECDRQRIPVLRLESIDKRMGHPSKAGMAEINRQLKEFLRIE